jgi:hypothetical protein
MPYTVKGKCVYKKDGGAKVGCTKGSVDKYLAALHANTNESENKIVGGKADKLSLEDIAKKFDVTVNYLNQQIEKGVKVEIEHTKDEEKAREIAMDHLSEFPDYYERLEKLETQAKKDWGESEKKSLTSEGLVKRLVRQKLNESIESFTNFVATRDPHFFDKAKQNPDFVMLEPEQVHHYPFRDAQPNKCETNVFLFCKDRGKHMWPVGGYLFERDFPVEHWWVYDSMLDQYLDVTPSSGPKSDITGYAGIVRKDLGEEIKNAKSVWDVDFFKGGNVYSWYFKH